MIFRPLFNFLNLSQYPIVEKTAGLRTICFALAFNLEMLTIHE